METNCLLGKEKLKIMYINLRYNGTSFTMKIRKKCYMQKMCKRPMTTV